MKINLNEPLLEPLELLAKEMGQTIEYTANHMLAIQIAVLALPMEDRKIIMDIYDKALDEN